MTPTDKLIERLDGYIDRLKLNKPTVWSGAAFTRGAFHISAGELQALLQAARTNQEIKRVAADAYELAQLRLPPDTGFVNKFAHVIYSCEALSEQTVKELKEVK